MPREATQKRQRAAAAADVGSNKLNIQGIRRRQSEWCWAACAEMVLRHNKKQGAGQCGIVTELLGNVRDCCSAPSTCNFQCKVSDVVSIFDRRGLKCEFRDHRKDGLPPTMQELRALIDGGSPVEVGIKYTNSSRGHVVIVSGYNVVTDASEWLVVNDPAQGIRTMTYRHLLTFAGQGRWTWTWTRFREK